jgi:hypothetical protein
MKLETLVPQGSCAPKKKKEKRKKAEGGKKA